MSKNVIAALLGIIIGYRGVSLMTHLFYLSTIIALVTAHYALGL